jgi:hypothetical protein
LACGRRAIKTCALSKVIKINKELHTSMTHSPARLPQAIVGGSAYLLDFNKPKKVNISFQLLIKKVNAEPIKVNQILLFRF